MSPLDSALSPPQTDACELFHADPVRVAEVRAGLPNAIYVVRSTDEGKSFSDPQQLAVINPFDSHTPQ